MEGGNAEKNYIICPRCGYKNPSSAKFCLNCGAKLIKEKGRDEGLVLTLLNLMSLIGLLDILLNSGVARAMATDSLLLSIGLLWFLGLIMVFYIGLKYRGRDFYLIGRDFKLLYTGVSLQFIGYLIFYIIFSMVGLIVISPLWILYAYLLRYLYKNHQK